MWPPSSCRHAAAASAPSASRSRTSSWPSGTGWCAAATPSPSSGWPMAPAHRHRPRPRHPHPDHPAGRKGAAGGDPARLVPGRPQRGERNRRVDLAYATTGHRAQGLTRWRALVRLTGAEDTNWLYVQLSRARHETTLYPVVGPEPQGPAELDLPDREVGDGYAQLAQALSRAGDQTLAIDTPSSLDLRRLSTRELRAERDRLRRLLDQAPRDRARELERATARRAEADQALAQVTTSSDPQRQGRGMLRQRRRGEPPSADRAAALVARQQADRAHDAELAFASASAAPGWLAGWRRMPTWVRPTARSSGSWPGRAAPAAWPPSTSRPP